MKKSFGVLVTGEEASLYTISCGGLTATITDYGAHLVSLLVPDKNGNVADVVLGYDDAEGYRTGGCFFGAPVGRSANRIAKATFTLGEQSFRLAENENSNNLHSGPSFYHHRMWQVESHFPEAITLRLDSPDGDQGFPGHATIRVTYELDQMGGLHIVYDAMADKDTIFNLTNHSYFNLFGHEKTELCMDQILTIPSEYFNEDDAESIPTGMFRSVEGTPFDFRKPKPIGQDINADYDQIQLQGGFDHNYVIDSNPCAILSTPDGSRTMVVFTDCPGVQFYAGNFIIKEEGKNGVCYGKRSGICLETQFHPDSIHHPDWPQPVTKAGEEYHSETIYSFC